MADASDFISAFNSQLSFYKDKVFGLYREVIRAKADLDLSGFKLDIAKKQLSTKLGKETQKYLDNYGTDGKKLLDQIGVFLTGYYNQTDPFFYIGVSNFQDNTYRWGLDRAFPNSSPIWNEVRNLIADFKPFIQSAHDLFMENQQLSQIYNSLLSQQATLKAEVQSFLTTAQGYGSSLQQIPTYDDVLADAQAMADSHPLATSSASESTEAPSVSKGTSAAILLGGMATLAAIVMKKK